MPPKVEPKWYECTKCGYRSRQHTNHWGDTWSFGHINTCPKCPPHAKYPEFGGMTLWKCVQEYKWELP